MSENASTRVRQYRESSDYLERYSSAHSGSILLGDFNHTSYSELDAFFGRTRSHSAAPPTSSYEDLAHPGKDKDGDSLRDGPTFGSLYPFFPNSNERRKPRRIDLILGSRGAFQLLSTRTEGGRPVEVERKEKRKTTQQDGQTGGQPGSTTVQSDGGGKSKKRKKMKLRCQEGKGGYLVGGCRASISEAKY